MYLFVGISLLTLLLNFSQAIIKLLPFGSCFFKHEEDSTALKEIEALKNELKELDETELDSYAKMVRRMRVENKIDAVRKKMKVQRDYNKLKGASVERLLGYAIKGVILITLATISIKYRYTPLVVFDERFSFAPFSGIVMFPTGVQNSISVPFWVLSCNLTFQWFRNILKSK